MDLPEEAGGGGDDTARREPSGLFAAAARPRDAARRRGAEEPDSCLLLAQAPVLGDSGNGAPEEFGTSEDNKAAVNPGEASGLGRQRRLLSPLTCTKDPDIRLAAPLRQHR